MDTLTLFDRCAVISLRRAPQRLESFRERLAACQWPFATPAVFDAIDGKLCQPAPWWTCGPGAWGCMRSHLGVIESAINDGVQRLLVLEDDAAPIDGFAEKAVAFLNAVPSNAELVYMGGQLNHIQQQPERVSDLVIRPHSVNRLHCYSLNRSGMVKVYRHLCRLDWYRGEQTTNANGEAVWKGGHHVDHRVEILSRNKQLATYAPAEWLVNQAGSYSEIMNRHMPERSFAEFTSPPQTMLAVLGPYRGGTSAVAGAMHNLGIPMGRWFFQATKQTAPKGCFEAMMLRKVCQTAYPEPTFNEACSREDRLKLLRMWMEKRAKDGTVIGCKNPLLCLMVPELTEAWPGCKFVVVHRKREHVIDSLRKLGWFLPATQPDALTHRLVDSRDAALQAIANDRQLHVEYEAMLENPEAMLKVIAQFANIEPTPAQQQNALNFLDRQYNHHDGTQQPAAACDCGPVACSPCACGVR